MRRRLVLGVGPRGGKGQCHRPYQQERPPARAPSDRRAGTRPRVSSPLSSRPGPVVASPSGLSPVTQERRMTLDQQIAANVRRPSRYPSGSNATRPQPESATARAAIPSSSSAAGTSRGDVSRSQSSRQTRQTQPIGPISRASAICGNVSRSKSARPSLPSAAVEPFLRIPETSGNDLSRRQSFPASSLARPLSSGPYRSQVQRSKSSQVAGRAREAL